ncbi:hypothetical protein WN943_011347 [Citrus x changshan-huyou]
MQDKGQLHEEIPNCPGSEIQYQINNFRDVKRKFSQKTSFQIRHLRPSALGIISSHLHLLTRFCSVAAVTGVVRAAAAAQCSPLWRRQRQRHRLQLSIATLSSTISPSLCHDSHHYQLQNMRKIWPIL